MGGPADAGLGHQRRAAEFVAHDRDRGLAVDDQLGAPRCKCAQVNTAATGVSVPRPTRIERPRPTRVSQAAGAEGSDSSLTPRVAG
jgi:hypothetical protein